VFNFNQLSIFFLLKADCELILDIENKEWNRIENNCNIDSSKEFVDDSSNFMEASSRAHRYVLASLKDMCIMVTDWFDMVFT
jgi:hypothetical protein